MHVLNIYFSRYVFWEKQNNNACSIKFIFEALSLKVRLGVHLNMLRILEEMDVMFDEFW